MIRIPNDDVKAYLAEVRAEADKRGIRDKLERRLQYLEEYGATPTSTRCTLFRDSAPLSFGLDMQYENEDGSLRHAWSGALIFHGRHDGNGSGAAPTFAVTVEPCEESWSIHT
jgi:hypothetical protein